MKAFIIIYFALLTVFFVSSSSQAQLVEQNISSINIYEESNGVHQHTFQIADHKIFENINKERPGNYDFSTGTEFYDVYISDSEGVADSLGDYITIDCYFPYAYLNDNVGNNIDGIELSYLDGTKKYATEISLLELGYGLIGQIYIDSLGFNGRALGKPDGKSTRLGSFRSSMTLGKFKKADLSGGSEQQHGWNHIGADIQWSNYFPFPSEKTTNTVLNQEFNISDIDNGQILTGDINNDGDLELIYANKSSLKIYDGNGNNLFSSNSLFTNGYLSLIADINNDGVKDIGIGTEKSSNLAIKFYDVNGNIVKTFSKTGGSDSYIYPRAVLASGKLLAENNAGYALNPRGWSAFDLNTTQELWYYDIGPNLNYSSIADVNGNGKYRICGRTATVHNGKSGSGFNGNGTKTTDGDMWNIVIDEDGNEVFSKKYNSPSDGWARHRFIDFDGNGASEILAEESHSVNYYHGTSQLHIIDSNSGNILHSFDGSYDQFWYTSLCDINNDGIKDIVATNGGYNNEFDQYVFDSELNIIKSSSIWGYVQCTNDLTGNGENEIIFTNEDTLKITNSNYALLGTFLAGDKIKQVIISDINQNGVNDIIILADKIYVLEFGIATNIAENGVLPTNFSLKQNFPNPFNPSTVITYSLSNSGQTSLRIYDSQGKSVRNLVSRYQSSGNYQIRWDGKDNFGKNVASGTYFYQVKNGSNIETKKMLLIR